MLEPDNEEMLRLKILDLTQQSGRIKSELQSLERRQADLLRKVIEFIQANDIALDLLKGQVALSLGLALFNIAVFALAFVWILAL